MSPRQHRRKDPAAVLVEFFETAPIEVAQTVIAICDGIIRRRMGATAAPTKREPRKRGRVNDDAEGPPLLGAERVDVEHG